MMKKRFFLRVAIILVFLVSLNYRGHANAPNLFSVTQEKTNFAFGLKASFHFNKLYFNKNFTSSFEPGFEGGLLFRLGKRFYVQPELLYSFRQTKFNLLLNEVQTNIDAQNHYLIIPVLFGYKILNGEKSNFHIIAGPKFAYRFATNTPKVKDIFKPFEIGCEVGGGFDVWIFTLDISYNFYFSQSKTDELSEGILHQSMYNASLGIKF